MIIRGIQMSWDYTCIKELGVDRMRTCIDTRGSRIKCMNLQRGKIENLTFLLCRKLGTKTSLLRLVVTCRIATRKWYFNVSMGLSKSNLAVANGLKRLTVRYLCDRTPRLAAGSVRSISTRSWCGVEARLISWTQCFQVMILRAWEWRLIK